jgi:DNA-binding transcriptional LysR family regulator
VSIVLEQLDAIRVFAAVAEHRSFRGAAKTLGLPRSTVSRRLAELEDALDTRLIHRTTRHVSLTDAGATFLARVTPALDAIADAGRAAADASSEPRGLLRVTATPSMADRLGPAMFELLEKHPQVRVEIDLTDRHVDLVGEGYDLAIRAGALRDSTLIARPLGKGQSGYFASPAYLARRGTPTTKRELEEHDWIVFSGRQHVEDFAVKRRLTVNSLRLVYDAAIAGFGIAWLPETMWNDAIAKKRLIPVMQDHWPQSTTVQLVYPSTRHLAPQVRAAVDLLQAIVPWPGQSAPTGDIVPKRTKAKTRSHGKHPVHGRKR